MKRRTLFASLLGFFGIAARPKLEPDLSEMIALLRSLDGGIEIERRQFNGVKWESAIAEGIEKIAGARCATKGEAGRRDGGGVFQPMDGGNQSDPKHRIEQRNPAKLKLGAHFDHVDYCWRPYAERPEDHREDYDRLRENIRERGIVNPLICWEDHVLIGMRRCEIAAQEGIESVPTWQIPKEIAEDHLAVYALRDRYAKAEY